MRLTRVGVILIAGLVVAAGVCRASVFPAVLDWEMSGQWSAYGYRDTGGRDTDDTVLSDSRILLENQVDWADQNAFLRADVEWRFETFRGMDNHSQGDLRFRDVYADVKGDQFDLAVGQKRVTWGKLDELVILDRVSPQDLTHFVLYDKQERKDPALLVQHQWFGWEGVQLETVFLPVFQPSEQDFFGTNWAVFGHLKQAVAESPVYTAQQKNLVSAISVQDDEGVTSRSLKNSQAAVRLRGRRGEVDYGIYYLNLYHTTPVLKERTPDGNLVKRFLFEPTAANLNALTTPGVSGESLRLTKAHPRVNAAGFDWETVWGLFGLRGEAALFWGRPYLRDDFSYTEKDQVAFGLGIDHTTADQWYFDLQYLQDYIFSYEGLYGVEKSASSLAGTVSKTVWRGQVSFDLDWIWQVSYRDWMLNPEATYRWERPGVDISLGSFVFDGRRANTIFGRYERNDVVYVKLSGKF